MSEVKHTPGRWSVWNDHNGVYQVGPSINLKVASMWHPPLGKAGANARLIAAAPDMLAMLKVAQLWLDVDGRFDMQGINAAIAKAEIRS